MQNYSEMSENFWKGMSVWLETERPPLGLPFTGGIGMSIKGETERPEIGEIQLGNRWKYNLDLEGNRWKYAICRTRTRNWRNLRTQRSIS